MSALMVHQILGYQSLNCFTVQCDGHSFSMVLRGNEIEYLHIRFQVAGGNSFAMKTSGLRNSR